jgi:hypothetical protein
LLALAALQQVPTPGQIEQEVFQNVLDQPLGEGTVADLALPDEFVRRVADRIVRSSYEERYRIVVKSDTTGEEAPADPPSAEEASTTGPSIWIALAAAGIALVAIVATATARRRKDSLS